MKDNRDLETDKKERVHDHCIVFTNLFPSPADQEQGLFIAQLTEAMNREMGVTVVCPIPWFPNWKFLKRFKPWSTYSEVPNQADYKGIKVHYPRYLMVPKISALIHPLLIFIGAFGLLRRLFRTHPQAVISAHWIFPDCVAAAIFCRLYGKNLIVTARGCDINLYIQSPIKRPQILFALNQAQYIVTVSNSLKERVLAETPHNDKVTTIFNGIDRMKFYPQSTELCRSRLSISRDKYLLLCIGQLHPVKDHPTLFKGFKLALEKNPSIRDRAQLVVIGGGPSRDDLLQQIKQLNLEDFIILIDQISHNEVATWLSAADLLCLTSIREGRPNIVIEALACGRPVVATAVGGIPELITPDNGLLFEAGNFEACALQIEKAFNTNWDIQTIVKSIENLTWEGCAARYIQLIHNLK